MNVKLDVFQEILHFRITSPLEDKSLPILAAGLRKILQTPILWVFIDVSQLTVTPPITAILTESTTYPKSKTIQGVFYVGNAPGITQFPTMDAALKPCPSGESAPLTEKLAVEQEIETLTAKKQKLEEEIHKNADNKKRIEYDHQRLEKVCSLLQSEVNRLESVNHKNKNIPKLEPEVEKQISLCLLKIDQVLKA